MGRPPKDPADRQTAIVKVLLTEAEKEELREGAEMLGTAMGDVLREGGMRYLRREVKKAQGE